MTDTPVALRTEIQQIRREAAEWMQRRAFWDWNSGDEAEFERWLATSHLHHTAYLRVRAMWERTDRLTALRRPQNLRPERTPQSHRRRPRIASIAAAIVVLGVAGGITVRGFYRPAVREIETALGERQIVSLSDGSKIELNTDSSMRISARSRQAWLDRGEAYFEIVHDSQHPFSVYVGGKRIEDLGTKFVVRADRNQFTVGLIEGKAALRESAAPKSAQLAILSPGDVATATARGVTLKPKNEELLHNALAWRQGMLVFSGTSLNEVAAQLNRYNQRKVVIADPALEGMKLDASIPTNGVDAFVRVAKSYLGLHVRFQDDKIIITR